jgi:REP element-mobilizing transposase RayT
MKRSAYHVVRDKRAWEGPREAAEIAHEAALGSKGWYTRGYLPHYDQPGTIQMVTFRLADAMPASLRHEWAGLLAIEDEREQRTKLEEYLDRGRGACGLRDARAAAAVEAVLLRFNGQRYRLTAWVVMPNHVHVVFELWEMPLGRLLKAWKGAGANAVNRILGRSGELWQTEYWDRYMRDEAHFRKAQHYIEWNPVKAGLVRTPEAWTFSSANPKWMWSGAARYADGCLVKRQSPDAGVALADKNVRAPARENSVTLADKNVCAPGDVSVLRDSGGFPVRDDDDEMERGHSCPPVERMFPQADRNVGAPSRRVA